MRETCVQSLEGNLPGEEKSYPLQYSCLENSRDRGAWWATVRRVAKSWTEQLSFSQEASPKLALSSCSLCTRELEAPRSLPGLFLPLPGWLVGVSPGGFEFLCLAGIHPSLLLRVGCREGVQTGEGEIMKELPSECQFFKKIFEHSHQHVQCIRVISQFLGHT